MAPELSSPSISGSQAADGPVVFLSLRRAFPVAGSSRKENPGELIAELARLPLFASLSEAELRPLAAVCQVRSFKAGQVLFHEGDPGHALYLIRSGRVKIVRLAPDAEETVLAVAGPGECVGEMALLDGEPRSATLVALGRVEAVLLYREEFLGLLERQPGVALAVMAALTRRVRQLSEQVQDVMRLDVAGRIARTLLLLGEQHGEETAEGVRIPLTLSREELAQMVGVARETVSRELMRLQQRGVLSVDRGGITLHRAEQLQARLY